MNKALNVTKARPNPGPGYIVREQLGRGRWKEVYRVVKRGEWRDLALARFREMPSADDLLNELQIWFGLREELENVARFYTAFRGSDGDIYLVEELLHRPLEALAPLQVSDQFVRIARDLSQGVASLHRLGRVHRDLKLDNCGIDFIGRAKVFDLGSVTSEGKQVQGTTLTRAPELFKTDRVTKESDVWALGATLYALRTGEYPFVYAGEVRTRPGADDEERRKRFDEAIRDRVQKPDAEASLMKRVEQSFPDTARRILVRMLDFDSSKRPTADEARDAWDELSRRSLEPTKAAPTSKDAMAAGDLAAYLRAFLRGTTAMSSVQFNRVPATIEELKKRGVLHAQQLEDLKRLQEEAGRLRERLEDERRKAQDQKNGVRQQVRVG